MINDMQLPLNYNPLIKCYLQPAFSIGILENDNPSFNNKLYNQFINICIENHACIKQHPYLEFCADVYYYDLLYHNHYEGYRLMLSENSINKVEEDFYNKYFDLQRYIVEMISKGFYALGYWDEFYVSGMSANRNIHLSHQFLIYGYNLSKSVFYSVGYNNKGLYDKLEIKFDEFEKAIYSKHNPIFLLQIIKSLKKEYKLNIEEIENELKNYLSSLPGTFHKNRLTDKLYNLEDKIYGINAWKRLLLYIFSEPNYIDMRCVRALFEHKRLMNMRIAHLHSQGFITNYELVSNYNRIFENSQKVFNLCIKYNIKKELLLYNKIVNMLKDILEQEQICLKGIISHKGGE